MQIFCDQEFAPLMDKVKDQLDVTVNHTPTGEHVPEAEQNNRTVQELIWTTCH